MNKQEIFELVKIGYKKGFLDGINYQEEQTGDEVTTEEEFNKTAMADSIDEAIEKTIKDNNL